MSDSIHTEAEMLKLMEKVVARVLPQTIRNSNNSIQDGVVESVNTTTKVATVRVTGNNTILYNIKYVSNVSNPTIGAQCLLLSSDPKLRKRTYAIILV